MKHPLPAIENSISIVVRRIVPYFICFFFISLILLAELLRYILLKRGVSLMEEEKEETQSLSRVFMLAACFFFFSSFFFFFLLCSHLCHCLCPQKRPFPSPLAFLPPILPISLFFSSSICISLSPLLRISFPFPLSCFPFSFPYSPITFAFLRKTKHLYNWLCSSVGRLVGR